MEQYEGGNAGKIGLAVTTGLVPVMNPLFLPIHMTIFIILIIILLSYGFGLMSTLLIAWLVPAAIGALFAYSVLAAGETALEYATRE